ncbi:MAG TPA: PIN domain-containing protein [Candidatus Nanoarchaeia archaeon]|nr:PIN domain-containing protein [Candidatus Nanoarchaeia archaeon]
MFADTDFLLALLKESDWLKRNAESILEKHKGSINTSVSVMIELAIVCKRLRLNVVDTFASVFELVEINEEMYKLCLNAAIYIEKDMLNVFDAFHAAYCGNEAIISSDSAYDKLGLERIKLEKLPS